MLHEFGLLVSGRIKVLLWSLIDTSALTPNGSDKASMVYLDRQELPTYTLRAFIG